MKILYGTTNKAKLQAMKKALETFDIELISLHDVNSPLPSINENGTTPLENAELNAGSSFSFSNHPTYENGRIAIEIKGGVLLVIVTFAN